MSVRGFITLTTLFLIGYNSQVLGADACYSAFSTTGKVTSSQIQDAMMREGQPATHTLDIRASGELDQYHVLDDPKFVGKKVKVNFFDDKYAPGAKVSPDSIDQMVLTKDYLDPVSQQAIQTLKIESLPDGKNFEEVGVWVVHTANGSYKSQTFTSHEPWAIQNQPVLEGFQKVIDQVQRAEGLGVKIEDIEFYHTHYVKGEAFSPGDYYFQDKYKYLVKKHLMPGGTYSSYAVPINGEVLFRHSVQ